MLYAYNLTTGEYAMTIPFETEIEDGRTNIAPPEVSENEVAVFDKDSETWTIYPDYRFTHKMRKNDEILPIETYGDIPSDCDLISNEVAEQLEEQKRINMLTMTPLDFINVLVGFGLTLEQINAYLESDLSVKMQLTYCNLVYCGVAKALMPIKFDKITITAEMVEQAFIAKNPVVEKEVDDEIA